MLAVRQRAIRPFRFNPILDTVDPGTDPSAPLMPTIGTTGFQMKWSNDFDHTVTAGQWQASGSPYMGAPTTSDIGNGKFSYYPTNYFDTRSKHKDGTGTQAFLKRTTATLATSTANNTVSTSASFFLTTDVGRMLVGPGIPDYTLITAYVSATSVTISNTPTATASGVTAYIAADYGTYDPGTFSCDNSIMRTHISTTPDGVHHVSAPRPKLSDTDVSPWGVLGGAFTSCIRLNSSLPTYKVAHLLWPDSNSSNPDGEIDFPECTLNGTSTVKGFMHWQGAGGQNQTSGTSVVPSGTGWNIFRIEWRPNQANPAASTLKLILNPAIVSGACSGGTVLGNWSGSLVPVNKMHWVIQTETMIDDFVNHIDPTTVGDLEWAWMTFEKMV